MGFRGKGYKQGRKLSGLGVSGSRVFGVLRLQGLGFRGLGV